MKTCDKSHSHSKGPKVPKNVFWFTFFHTGTGYIATYYFSFYYMRNKPEDYPEHYYTFHFWLYNFVWVFCMTNLVLSRFKSPGKSCNTREESDGKCEKCNIYRTDRTHHCSNCKKCIVRMDHHCAWVSNCIGLNNHKNFFWYTFYTAIGGAYHVYLGLMYIFSSYPSAYESYLVRIWFYLHTLIIILFTYFCFTLTNMQVKFITRNNTNLEYMKEIGMNWDFMKCIIWPIESDYDRGLIPNLIMVFGFDFFWWLLPTSPMNYVFYQGKYALPKPTQREVSELKVKYDLDDDD